MFVILGFIICAAMLMFATMMSALVLWFCLPTYNPIGGARNTLFSAILAIAFAALTGFGWYWFFGQFTLTFNVT